MATLLIFLSSFITGLGLLEKAWTLSNTRFDFQMISLPFLVVGAEASADLFDAMLRNENLEGRERKIIDMWMGIYTFCVLLVALAQLEKLHSLLHAVPQYQYM